jgi:hypothetical protein
MTTSAGAEPVVGAQHVAVQGLQRSVRPRRRCLAWVGWLSALAVLSAAEAPTESNVERDSLATGPAAATCHSLPARCYRALTRLVPDRPSLPCTSE